MLAYMGMTIAATVLLAASGWAAERIAISAGAASRWVWIMAIVGSLVLPLAMPRPVSAGDLDLLLAALWALLSIGMLVLLALRLLRWSKAVPDARGHAHRAARDPQWLALAWLVLAALPWNLPLWWLMRRLRRALAVDCEARMRAAL